MESIQKNVHVSFDTTTETLHANTAVTNSRIKNCFRMGSPLSRRDNATTSLEQMAFLVSTDHTLESQL